MQVLCTLGSVVFVSILLIRGIWSGVSFLQESGHQKMDELDMHNAWNGAQSMTWVQTIKAYYYYLYRQGSPIDEIILRENCTLLLEAYLAAIMIA